MDISFIRKHNIDKFKFSTVFKLHYGNLLNEGTGGIVQFKCMHDNYIDLLNDLPKPMDLDLVFSQTIDTYKCTTPYGNFIANKYKISSVFPESYTWLVDKIVKKLLPVTVQLKEGLFSDRNRLCIFKHTSTSAILSDMRNSDFKEDSNSGIAGFLYYLNNYLQSNIYENYIPVNFVSHSGLFLCRPTKYLSTCNNIKEYRVDFKYSNKNSIVVDTYLCLIIVNLVSDRDYTYDELFHIFRFIDSHIKEIEYKFFRTVVFNEKYSVIEGLFEIEPADSNYEFTYSLYGGRKVYVIMGDTDIYFADTKEGMTSNEKQDFAVCFKEALKLWNI